MGDPKLIEFLSGGNHELFHSNILAYIAQKYPEYFRKILFRIGVEIPEEDFSDNVVREEKHFDFAIRKSQRDTDENEYTLVLENKMKSIPDMKQLAEYTKKATADNRVLLTMIEVNPENLEKGWVQISYAKLAAIMESEYTTYRFEPFFERLLEEYISYIKILSTKVEEIKKKFQQGIDKIKINEFFSEKDESADIPKWEKIFLRKVRFQLVADEIKSRCDKMIFCKAVIVRSNVPMIEVLPYNDDIKAVKNKYWIQIYKEHIERGFWLSYDTISIDDLETKISKKRSKNVRKELFNSLWKNSMKIDEFRKIAETLSNEPFNITEFSTNENNDKEVNFQGYIYKDFSLFYIRTDINEITIADFINLIILEINRISEILNNNDNY